jgi:hypothetical protein
MVCFLQQVVLVTKESVYVYLMVQQSYLRVVLDFAHQSQVLLPSSHSVVD